MMPLANFNQSPSRSTSPSVAMCAISVMSKAVGGAMPARLTADHGRCAAADVWSSLGGGGVKVRGQRCTGCDGAHVRGAGGGGVITSLELTTGDVSDTSRPTNQPDSQPHSHPVSQTVNHPTNQSAIKVYRLDVWIANLEGAKS